MRPAVLEAQLAAGLIDDAKEMLGIGAGALQSLIVLARGALARVGLAEEAFALALEHARSAENGVNAATPLIAALPEHADTIADRFDRTPPKRSSMHAYHRGRSYP